MKNKKYLMPMLLSILTFAFSTMWVGFEIWMKFESVTYEFDFKSIPTFAIFTLIYFVFWNKYNDKKKITDIITPINREFGVGLYSQNPIRICDPLK